jgi:diadenosine tetraphosphatase ApaH/serine/threonine PP2A family protein phosphatase
MLLCLGDLVGYGADPVACVELVGERAAAVVAGNPRRRARPQRLDWFNSFARAAALWTRDRLDEDHRRYLADLPLVSEIEEATLVHASPRHPEEWDYLLSAEDGFEVFGDFSTRLCFVGHSHRPDVWSLGSGGPEHTGFVVAHETGRRPALRREQGAASVNHATTIRARRTSSGTATSGHRDSSRDL